MDAPPDPAVVTAVERYIGFWRRLSAATLDSLDDHVTPDFRFADPFGDHRGIDRVRAQFARTFAMIDDVDITVTDYAISGRTAYLRWSFAYTVGRRRRPWRIEGVSEIHIAPDGRASAHIDHWDAAGQTYEKLPVIGPVLRALRRRIAAG